MYILLGLLGILALMPTVFVGIKINQKYFISWEVACLFYRFFGRDHLCGCGHKAKRRTRVVVDGKKEGFFTLRDKGYCPDCFLGASIKCALCEKTIFPGSSIALYFRDSNFQLPSGGVIYEDESGKKRIVVCTRQTCSEFGIGDAMGFWEMPGQVSKEDLLTVLAFANGSHTN